MRSDAACIEKNQGAHNAVSNWPRMRSSKKRSAPAPASGRADSPVRTATTNKARLISMAAAVPAIAESLGSRARTWRRRQKASPSKNAVRPKTSGGAPASSQSPERKTVVRPTPKSRRKAGSTTNTPEAARPRPQGESACCNCPVRSAHNPAQRSSAITCRLWKNTAYQRVLSPGSGAGSRGTSTVTSAIRPSAGSRRARPVLNRPSVLGSS